MGLGTWQQCSGPAHPPVGSSLPSGAQDPAQSDLGRKGLTLLQGASPEPSTTGWRRAGARKRPGSVRVTGSGRLPSAGPQEASMSHQAEETVCVKARVSGVRDDVQQSLVSKALECQASGSRAATESATNRPAMGGHIGSNGLESENKAEAGAMGGPAPQRRQHGHRGLSEMDRREGLRRLSGDSR